MLWFFWVWRRTTNMIQQRHQICIQIHAYDFFFFEKMKIKHIANVHRLVYTTVGLINDEFHMNSESAQFSRESSAFHGFHFFFIHWYYVYFILVLGLIIWMYSTDRQFCRWVWIKTFPLFFHGDCSCLTHYYIFSLFIVIAHRTRDQKKILTFLYAQ